MSETQNLLVLLLQLPANIQYFKIKSFLESVVTKTERIHPDKPAIK